MKNIPYNKHFYNNVVEAIKDGFADGCMAEELSENIDRYCENEEDIKTMKSYYLEAFKLFIEEYERI